MIAAAWALKVSKEQCSLKTEASKLFHWIIVLEKKDWFKEDRLVWSGMKLCQCERRDLRVTGCRSPWVNREEPTYVMVHIFDYHSWSNWNLEMLIFEKRGKLEYPEKTFQSKGENEQQTQPTCGIHTWVWTSTTLVGGDCSHHLHHPCFPHHPSSYMEIK